MSAVTSSVSWRSFSLIVGLVWCKEFLCFADNLSLRSVCPFVSVCCCSVRIFTSKRNAPSLRAPRAETRLTVYRALRSVDFPRNFAFLLGNKLFMVSGRLWNRYLCFRPSVKDSTSSRAETWLTVYRPYEICSEVTRRALLL